MKRIVDTNVVLIANDQHQAVSPGCALACIKVLSSLKSHGVVVVDDQFRILKEYQNKTSPQKGGRVGDLFVKWILQNLGNPKRCEQVPLTELADGSLLEFPQDARLENFDTSDKKFVAVAAAHPEHPPILQAADSKWLNWAPALRDNALDIEFICPEDLKQFHAKKFGE